jgi:ribosomal protein L31
MRTIQFEDVVSPEEFSVLAKESVGDSEWFWISSKPKKEYAIMIPEEFKGFEVPESINAFIEGILENMRVYVLSKTRNPAPVQEIIHNFVEYMLDVDREGKQRYLRYDNKAYPDQPYYKWFLVNLYYFYLTYRTKKIKYDMQARITEGDVNSVIENRSARQVHIDLVSGSHKAYVEPEEQSVVSDLKDQVKKFSEKYSGFRCFEAHAHDLLMSRLNGERNNDFAKRLGISASAASQWANKLKKLVQAYFNGDQVEVAVLA